MIHTLWPYHVGIYDNLLDVNSITDIVNRIDQALIDKKTFYDSYEAADMPAWITPLTDKMTTMFSLFRQEAGIEGNFEPLFYQTIKLEAYNKDNAFDASWEMHNDIFERAMWSVTYYLRTAENSTLPDGYIGGELSIHDRFDYASYPNNIQIIECKENRMVIFSPVKEHRIRPYFGSTPRLSISQFWTSDVLAMSSNASRVL